MAKVRGHQKIEIKTIEAVAKLLDKLEPKLKSKPKLELSQSSKLFNLRHKIERVLRLGYSYEEIVEVLKQQNINISTEKLKKYLSNADNKSELL